METEALANILLSMHERAIRTARSMSLSLDDAEEIVSSARCNLLSNSANIRTCDHAAIWTIYRKKITFEVIDWKRRRKHYQECGLEDAPESVTETTHDAYLNSRNIQELLSEYKITKSQIRLIAMRCQGYSLHEIARITSVSRVTVWREFNSIRNAIGAQGGI